MVCVDGFTTAFLADKMEVLVRAVHKKNPGLKAEFRTVKTFNGQTRNHEFSEDYEPQSYHLKANGYSTKALILPRKNWGDEYMMHPISNFETYALFPLINPDDRELDFVLNQMRKDEKKPTKNYNTCVRCSPKYSKQEVRFVGGEFYFLDSNIYFCRRCGLDYCDGCLEKIGGLIRNYVVGRIKEGAKNDEGLVIPHEIGKDGKEDSPLPPFTPSL